MSSFFGIDLPSAIGAQQPTPPRVAQKQPANPTIGKKRAIPEFLNDDNYAHAMGGDDDDEEKSSEEEQKSDDEQKSEEEEEPIKKKRGRPRKNAPQPPKPETKRRKKASTAAKKPSASDKVDDDADDEDDDKDTKDDDEVPNFMTKGEEKQSVSLIMGPDRRQSERERTAKLLQKFTPEQLRRYEAFKRSKFQFSAIKKVMAHAANVPTNQAMQIVMAGITKLYVGDLVENSKLIMQEWGDTGPIQPKHLKEAYRRLQEKEQTKLNFKH
jgi:transcription initiation factor TFIID subunit 11